MSAVLLDPRSGRPERDLDPLLEEFGDDRLTCLSTLPTREEFMFEGKRFAGPRYVPDDHDRAILSRLPKSVRRYMELAERERLSGAGLKTGALVAGQTQAWAGHLQPSNVLVADQTPITGVAEALLYPFGFTLIPGGYWVVGSTVKLTVCGKITTAGATPGNLSLTNRYGSTTAGTSLAASAALALQISQTNITWMAELYIVCRASNASGGTGSLIVIGNFQGGTGTTLFTTGPMASIPASAPVVASPDTAVQNALLLDGTLGSASDSMTTQLVIPLAVC